MGTYGYSEFMEKGNPRSKKGKHKCDSGRVYNKNSGKHKCKSGRVYDKKGK